MACQGQLPGEASPPPTMRVLGRDPHSPEDGGGGGSSVFTGGRGRSVGGGPPHKPQLFWHRFLT